MKAALLVIDSFGIGALPDAVDYGDVGSNTALHICQNVPVVHLSWERLLSEAQLLSRRKEVADPDQQWMLEEWIRYIVDENSRIIEPPQMGKHWKEVLRAAREGNLAGASSSAASRRLTPSLFAISSTSP